MQGFRVFFKIFLDWSTRTRNICLKKGFNTPKTPFFGSTEAKPRQDLKSFCQSYHNSSQWTNRAFNVALTVLISAAMVARLSEFTREIILPELSLKSYFCNLINSSLL